MPAWISILLQIILWCCLAYLFYVEAGYLLLLWLIAQFRIRPVIPVCDSCPPITVLVAAHNEEKVIADRLENLLSQDYPDDRLQVIVASDHSTDRTDEIVLSYSGRGVMLCQADQHGGKIAALRKAEPLISGAVVVFTDADSCFHPGALRKLVSHFSDPQVGAVSGREVRPAKGEKGEGKGEGLFNRIETLVKKLESRIGSQVLLHGGIFAIRRELLPFVPDHLTHDGVVPVKLKLDGFATNYEPGAVSEEAYHLDTRQDFQRRIRTVMQALQSYLFVREGLNPFKTGFFALQIWSHRLMRWLVFPAIIVTLFISLLLSAESYLYFGLVIIQGLCYLLALLGMVFDRFGLKPTILYFPYYFLYIHLAAMIAVILTIRGKTVATWQTLSRRSVLAGDTK